MFLSSLGTSWSFPRACFSHKPPRRQERQGRIRHLGEGKEILNALRSQFRLLNIGRKKYQILGDLGAPTTKSLVPSVKAFFRIRA